MMEVPEISQPLRPRTGRNWLDLTVALAALTVSVVSIVVALRQGDAMERLVQAQSWPRLSLINGNVQDGVPAVRISVRNAGSGPAQVEALSVTYAGTEVSSWTELLRACCTSSPEVTDTQLLQETDGAIVTSSVAGAVLLPGDEQVILELPRTEGNELLWTKLNDERFKIEFRSCYCSVFNECYVSGLAVRQKPAQVNACPDTGPGWTG